MPTYEYLCTDCHALVIQARHCDARDSTCRHDCASETGMLRRRFTPTANIVIAEHFRHSQHDFLPPKGDPAWEKIQMGGDSQMHSRPSAGEQLARELENA